ncbi:hypothetical protein SCLCIDRAFT_81953, partial [Scleroderma citrinum Foug A]
WQWWSQDIIPALVKPYMQYLKASQSLRMTVDPKVLSPGQCPTCPLQRLTVCCLFFDHEAEICYCMCIPAPICLMAHGLFACSPVAPTLAIDLCVLEFVKTLFVRLTPNTTAWCDALGNFLDAQGYKLQSKV